MTNRKKHASVLAGSWANAVSAGLTAEAHHNISCVLKRVEACLDDRRELLGTPQSCSSSMSTRITFDEAPEHASKLASGLDLIATLYRSEYT